MFNDFFCNQSDLDDTNIPTPNIFIRHQGSLGHIVITENEVEDIPSTILLYSNIAYYHVIPKQFVTIIWENNHFLS
jgi:hypothetical protein